MATYEIYSYEISSVERIDAPGIIEAIAEYLPWPTVDISITYKPTYGQAKIVDNQTGFMYDIELV